MTDEDQQNPIDRAKFDVHPDVSTRFTDRVLLPRKRRMISAYVREGTLAAAARASGYSRDKVKDLIENDQGVRKAIGEVVDQAAVISGVTLERVLQEYARLAFSDVGEIADLIKVADDPDAAMEVLADLPPEITAAISEISVTRSKKATDDGDVENGSFKVKLIDKKSALQDLGRMLSLFNDKLTIDDKSGFGDRLERAVAKIEGMTGGDGD